MRVVEPLGKAVHFPIYIFEHIGARIPRCPRAVQRERWAACQTALLSAINAATLKPTQSAMWLRRPVPPAERNAV